MSKQFISGSWRRVLWTRTEPQEWGQTTCQNDQRGKRNKARLFPSAPTAKAFTFQFLLPGVYVCFLFFCFVLFCFFWVCGWVSEPRMDRNWGSGLAAKRTPRWWKLLKASDMSGSWYYLWERRTRCHWWRGLCNQALHKSSRFSFSPNPSVLLYNSDPSFAFTSKLDYCAMCVSVYVYTLLQIKRHTIIRYDWVTSLLELRTGFEQTKHTLNTFSAGGLDDLKVTQNEWIELYCGFWVWWGFWMFLVQQGTKRQQFCST